MSGTHAHTVAYVAPTQFREESPPASEVGFLGWLRENFFSSWWNTLLTILSLAFLAAILPALDCGDPLKSVWNANSSWARVPGHHHSHPRRRGTNWRLLARDQTSASGRSSTASIRRSSLAAPNVAFVSCSSPSPRILFRT